MLGSSLNAPLATGCLAYLALYAAALSDSMRRHRVSRKFNMLVMSKSAADASICLCVLADYFFASDFGPKNNTSSFMKSIGNGKQPAFSHRTGNDFFRKTVPLSLMLTSLSSFSIFLALKIYGVRFPFQFHKRLVLKDYVHITIVSWTLFSIFCFLLPTISHMLTWPFVAVYYGLCIILIILHLVVLFGLIINIILIAHNWLVARRFHRLNQANLSLWMLNRCYRYPLVKTGIRFVAFTAGHLLLFFMLTAEFISFGKKRAFFPSNSRENPLIWTGVLARILLDAISGIHADIEVSHSFVRLYRKFTRQSKFPSASSAVSLSAGGGSHSPRPRAAETVFSHHYNKKAGGNGKLLLSVRNNLSFRSLQGNCPAVMATNMAADKKKKKRRSSTSGSLGAEEEEVEAEVVTVATKEKTADGRGKVFEDEEQRKMDGENGEDSEKGKRNGEAQKLSSSEEEVEAEEHDPPVLGHQLEHTRKGVEPEAVVHSLQKGRAPKRHSSRRLQRRGLLLLSDSIMRRASVPVPSVNSHQWKEATEQCRRKLTSVGMVDDVAMPDALVGLNTENPITMNSSRCKK